MPSSAASSHDRQGTEQPCPHRVEEFRDSRLPRQPTPATDDKEDRAPVDRRHAAMVHRSCSDPDAATEAARRLEATFEERLQRWKDRAAEIKGARARH
jgi:hypothetical protein